MADIIRMPRLSDTMKVGVIRSWSKKVGDKVQPGDILAEVETDKATMDLEAFQEGVLLYIAVPEGQIEVDGIIAIIGKEGEDYKSLLEQKAPEPSNVKKTEEDKSKETPTETVATPIIGKSEEVKSKETQAATTSQTQTTTESRIKASPLAKSIAKEKGIDLKSVAGSGENGRIIKKDIEQSIASPSAKSTTSISTPVFKSEGDTEVAVSQMRQTIANRLSESKFSAPHFYLTMEI
ncbi:MAG: biotin/lipoyl-containing protein, partial [Saprospiraceae bacterium]